MQIAMPPLQDILNETNAAADLTHHAQAYRWEAVRYSISFSLAYLFVCIYLFAFYIFEFIYLSTFFCFHFYSNVRSFMGFASSTKTSLKRRNQERKQTRYGSILDYYASIYSYISVFHFHLHLCLYFYLYLLGCGLFFACVSLVYLGCTDTATSFAGFKIRISLQQTNCGHLPMAVIFRPKR